MKKSKTSISQASSYEEMGGFWDTHSLADYWDQTKAAQFQVDIQSEVTYFPIARGLSTKILRMAKRQGISSETLLNMWVQEKLEKA